MFEERFFLGALSCGSALVVVENETGKIIGSSRYYEWAPDDREISIGYTFLERSHWGVGSNTVMKALMLNYIFEWADVVWFHIGKTNLRSRAAVEKLGAVLSFEEERQLDGSTYFQLYYRLDANSYNSQLAENTGDFTSGI